MRIEYTLQDAGWATATVGDGGRQVVMTVSYLHDSLAQLAGAALALRDGGPEASVIFMDEPGEHHVVFRRRAGDVVSVEVRQFDDWASWHIVPADQFDVVFEGSTTLQEVIEQVAGVLGRLVEEHGLEGYRKRWIEHEFPSDAYEELLRA